MVSLTTGLLAETVGSTIILHPSRTKAGENFNRTFETGRKKAGLRRAALVPVTFGSPAFPRSGSVAFCPYVTAGLALSCNAMNKLIVLYERTFNRVFLSGKDWNFKGLSCPLARDLPV